MQKMKKCSKNFFKENKKKAKKNGKNEKMMKNEKMKKKMKKGVCVWEGLYYLPPHLSLSPPPPANPNPSAASFISFNSISSLEERRRLHALTLFGVVQVFGLFWVCKGCANSLVAGVFYSCHGGKDVFEVSCGRMRLPLHAS